MILTDLLSIQRRSESEKVLELRVYSVFKTAGFGVEF